MEKKNLILLLVCCLFGHVVYASDENSKLIGQKQASSWCIFQLTTPPEKMQAFLDYACGKIDCGPIKPGGVCFFPDVLPAHANYALNAIYHTLGTCDLQLGFVTTLDPSYGDCKYQGS
ncbi:hypothetical protein BUALT_Bualt19G0079200 [Buddleja alternifolia]|uniref:X8 domain-containing protein n=1 Tax=Buddleja alternifolia TaxID=168488 RepID=A0AAV6W2S6_9LAMI|nr:hypothetical protein BUALT_Bualt19G0079200 [Buddleja alternifolia]